jgi:hypothetical protein
MTIEQQVAQLEERVRALEEAERARTRAELDSRRPLWRRIFRCN